MQTVLVLDFGSQYTKLIARRVREAGVYCEVVRCTTSPEELNARDGLVGVILSGGPASVYGDASPMPHPQLWDVDVPMLGICYGMQVACQLLGGGVSASSLKEYGRTALTLGSTDDPLLEGLPKEMTVWMSHGDAVTELGDEFVPLASTASTPLCAVRHATRRFWGIQFHPEVTHTPQGKQILSNFLFGICGAAGDWSIDDIRKAQIASIRERVGADEQVICGLSGGVDSAVTAALLHEAIGDRLVAIFVDHGLLRADEREEVDAAFRDHFGVELVIADARERFLDKLAGVTDPERKRKIIGHEFIDVFKAEADKVPNAKYLAQGTLYPDVIESISPTGGPSVTIKSHHNVGGLPEELGFELIEPLRELFKDEVRELGRELGLPESIVGRHPFPGPGLAIRVLGEITEERLIPLRAADKIVREELHRSGWYDKSWQAFAVLLPVNTVGVMGDERTYEAVCAIRVINSVDGMTADWVRLPYDLLDTMSSRIGNEVAGINRVCYDISSKPPATIEWE